MTLTVNSILRQFKNEFIFGGHITALIAPSFVLISVIILDLPVNYYALLVAYLIPLLVYSYNYQKEADHDSLTNSEKSFYLNSRKNVFNLLFGSYLLLALIFTALLASPQFFIFLLIIFTGGILYTVIFKQLAIVVPAFKNVYSTAIWAYAGTFFNIFLYNLGVSPVFIFLFSFIYLKIFINNVFFDLKDINADREAGLKTIPILLGKNNTVYFLSGVNILSLLLLAYCAYAGIIPLYALSLAVFFLYTQYYLWKGKFAATKDLLNYTYVISDAEFIFWPLALMIGKLIMNMGI